MKRLVRKIEMVLSVVGIILCLVAAFFCATVISARAEGSGHMTLTLHSHKVEIQNPYDVRQVTVYETLGALEKQLCDLYISQPIGSKIKIKSTDLNALSTFLHGYEEKVGIPSIDNSVVDGQIVFETATIIKDGDYFVEFLAVTDARKTFAQRTKTTTYDPDYMRLLKIAYDHTIAAGVNNNMSQMEAYNCIKDYVESYIDYDYSLENWDFETTIYEGKGTCSAYSDIMVAMCTIAGIPCERVESYNMNHGWNRIRIDDVWYWADITWDDITHTYGLSETLWQDHNYNDVTEWTLEDSIYRAFDVK